MKVKLQIEATIGYINFIRTIYKNKEAETGVTNTMSIHTNSIQSITFKVSRLGLLYGIEVIKKDGLTLENAIDFQLGKRIFEFENFNEEDFGFTRNFEQLVNYLKSTGLNTKIIYS